MANTPPMTLTIVDVHVYTRSLTKNVKDFSLFCQEDVAGQPIHTAKQASGVIQAVGRHDRLRSTTLDFMRRYFRYPAESVLS